MVYTAKYIKKSVYDNIIDPTYITWTSITSKSATLSRVSQAKLRGKITLPLLDGKDIYLETGLLQNGSTDKLGQGRPALNSSEITHIFF